MVRSSGAWLGLMGLVVSCGQGRIVGDGDDPGRGPGGSGGGGAGGGGGKGMPPGGLIDSMPPPRPTPDMTGSAPCTPGAIAVTPRLVRLTRLQYENSVRDLTGLDVRPARDLPADATRLGYDRMLDLEVGDLQGRVFSEQAAAVARQLATTPGALQRVLACSPGDACIATFIADFGRKAFRRPLTDAEKARYAALFRMGNTLVESGEPFARGVQVTVEAMLQSPHFLYRFESAAARDGGPVALGSHELAARLSYMLVNSTPDAPLSLAADRGELADPAALVGHARRLLATPGGQAMIRAFFGQWLQAEEWAKHLDKSATRYPAWKPTLLPVLAEELDRFTAEVTFARKRGLATLLTASFTYANRDTAPIYGLTAPLGAALERVELPARRQAGILGQIGFLAGNASALTSSPIHRGVFVQRSLLCTPIPPPGQQVPPVPPTTVGKTTREVVSEHTGGEGCRACHHSLINPVGFGLENFDAIGGWRDQENGKPIDATGSLVGTAGNAPFASPVEMARAIAAAPEARACFARQWLRYGFGREEGDGDRCALEVLAGSIADDAYTPIDLVVDLVRSRAFMFRSAEVP